MQTWADGHLDLAYLAVDGRDLRRRIADPNAGCVSLPALREAAVELICATIFTEPGAAAADKPYGYASSDDLDGAEAVGLRQFEIYEQLESEGELAIVRCRSDLERAGHLPRVVLLMEGADPIRSPDHVSTWHARGVRIVGLTWHMGTRYAGGNTSHGPLTPLGREMIRALDAHQIVHDISHLSDAATEELFGLTDGPVIASHSNCRALMDDPDNQRHLRDETIAEIGRRGGVVGLNLYSKFLVPASAPGGWNSSTPGRATVDDCVRHIEHICEVMGHRRGIGLGSDMDGGFAPTQLPEGLDHPSKLTALAKALGRCGWKADELVGFAHRNWQRLISELLPDNPSKAAHKPGRADSAISEKAQLPVQRRSSEAGR